MRATIASTIHWAVYFAVAVSVQVSEPSGRAGRTASTTPDNVMAQFARLNADGAQLTPEGWQTIAALFTSPGNRLSLERLSIVSDRYDVIKAVMRGERVAEARVDYTHVGFLDMSTGVFSSEHAGLYLRDDYKLVRVDGPPSPAQWKIEGAVPLPHITRTTAVRYVTRILEKTMDRTVAKNLEAARASLERRR